MNPATKRAYIALLHAHTRLTGIIEETMTESGVIPLNEYDVLVTLEYADGGTMRMSDLASQVIYSRSGLSRLVSRLERRGLVARDNCNADGRVIWCTITDEGRKTRAEAWPVLRAAMVKHFGDACTPAEAEILERVFRRVLGLCNASSIVLEAESESAGV